MQVRHFTRDVTVSCIRVGNERVCLFGTPVSSFSLCVPGRRRTNNKQWHAAATPTHAQPAHTYPSEREEGVLLLLVERRPEFGEAELLLLVLLVPLPTGPTAQAAAHGWRCWSLRRGQQYPETRLLSLSPPPPPLCCCRPTELFDAHGKGRGNRPPTCCSVVRGYFRDDAAPRRPGWAASSLSQLLPLGAS